MAAEGERGRGRSRVEGAGNDEMEAGVRLTWLEEKLG